MTAAMRRCLPWGLAALAVVTGLALSSETPDDTFISLRYARNLAAGQGLVFNPGERVEGFSNPLWTLMLAGLIWLGLPALLAAKLLGVATFAATVVLAWRVMERVVPGAGLPATLVAPLFVALDPFSALWAGSGMETPLAALLVLGLLAALLRAGEDGRGFGAGVLLGLLCLTRPEAPLYGLIAAVWVAARRRWRSLPGIAAGCALVFGPYLVFRVAYYDDLLPNTAYAKRTAGMADLLANGLVYLRWWSEVLGPWAFGHAAMALAAAAAVVVRPRALARHGVALAALFLATQVLFVLVVGGDWMEGFRFFVPVVPALALWIGAGAACLPRAAGWLLLAVLVATHAGTATGLCARLAGIGQRLFAVARPAPWHAMLDRLETLVPRGSLVAAHEIGNLGFRLEGRRILDLWGLTDRAIARSPDNIGMLHGNSGDPELVLARRPDFVVAWEMARADGRRHVQAVVVELLRTREFSLGYDEIARIPEAERTQGGWLQETVVWQRRAQPRIPEAPAAAIDVAAPETLGQVLEGVYREQDGLRWCADRVAVLLAVPAGATQVVVTGGFPESVELACQVDGRTAGPAAAVAAGLGEVGFRLPAPLPAAGPVEVTLLGKPVRRDARDPRRKVFVLQRIELR